MLLAVAGLLAWPTWAAAAPSPSVAPRNWQLDFDFEDLQRLDVVLPGDRQPTTFWYMVYTVTNNSGKDVEFYPSFQLVTSTLQVVTGGDNISPSVYDAIAAQYRNMYPFFRVPTDMTGTLLQGPDNSRTSAAVFRDFDRTANEVTVYVGGLSGEIVSVPNPSFDPEKPESAENMRFFPLRKTLAIPYDIPGDERTRQQAPPVRKKTDWVMR